MILKRHLTSMRATFRPIMHAWSFKFSELLYHARTYHDLRYQNWTPHPPPTPLLTKKPLGTCCYVPPLLTKNARNLLLYPHSSQKPLGTCCYTPPPSSQKKNVVYIFSRLLSFTKRIRCHHLSHTDVIFLWRLSGGFYQNYCCFYNTVFFCMCICI